MPDLSPEIQMPLADWLQAIDSALAQAQPARAVDLARVVLERQPRLLAVYARLLDALWQLKRWDEGGEWGRRLLQADPGQPLAWRAMATAIEQHEDRPRAHAAWRRAFELDPYQPDIRAGMQRTHLPVRNEPRSEAAGDSSSLLALNAACLAALYLRAGRWRHAAAAYRGLSEAAPRRLDFPMGEMAARWQLGQAREAYALARQLVERQRYLLLPWAVLAATGDADDRALARDPLQRMDPDGAYTRERLHLRPVAAADANSPATLKVGHAEAALLESGRGT